MKKNPYRSRAAFKEMMTGYLLLSPAIILFLVMGLVSVLLSIGLSFVHLGQGQLLTSARFAGLDNFKDFLFGGAPVLSDQFWGAITHNIYIALAMVVIVIPLALMLALMLESITHGVRFFRTVFLLPMVTSSVAIYYVWTGIYDPSGTLNQVLSAIGLDNLVAVNGWIGELNTALPAIIVTVIWGAIPGTMILYFAGLQIVDRSLYEAAEIDGANAFQKVLHITWPILRPITVIAVILNLNAALQIFDQVWVMTQGGPAGSTEVVNVLVYKEAFVSGDMGRANAMGWTIFLLTFTLSMISMRALRDKT